MIVTFTPLLDRGLAVVGEEAPIMVDIHISGVHFQVSEKIKTHIHEKLGSLSRFHTGLKTLHVTIHEAEKFGYRVDVDMHLPHGKHVVAHDNEETVYSAIDMVSDKCAAQLRKIHEREIDSHRHAAVIR
ncbi:MAG: ribosome-associated translation inhibitor RaiA [Planctomycetes bacterium]|nr:ribosome-associated translation inhibitor RaiA [Planctomycetota bacterium]